SPEARGEGFSDVGGTGSLQSPAKFQLMVESCLNSVTVRRPPVLPWHRRLQLDGDAQQQHLATRRSHQLDAQRKARLAHAQRQGDRRLTSAAVRISGICPL